MNFYRLSSSHLGDQWARLNTALKYAQTNELHINIAEKHWNTIQEILSLLDVKTTASFGKGHENSDLRNKFESENSYHTIYFPTKITHDPRYTENIIVYNFSARWEKEKKRPEKIEEILSTIQSKLPNIKLIQVGLPMSLTQTVKLLAKSKLLLSIDNGIAHVARSVGVPMFLIEHKLPLSRGFPESSCQYVKVTKDSAVDIITSHVKQIKML